MNERTAVPYQQGDVFLYPTKIPAGATPVVARADGRVILAEGEATGHAHAVVAEPGILVSLVERNGVTYLRTSGPADVVHEEHKPIGLPGPGEFEVRRVQEFDHFAEEARNVAD